MWFSWAFRGFLWAIYCINFCLFSVFIFHFLDIALCQHWHISTLFSYLLFMISRPLRSLVFPRCFVFFSLVFLSPTVGICGLDSQDCRHVQTGDVQINNFLVLLQPFRRWWSSGFLDIKHVDIQTVAEGEKIYITSTSQVRSNRKRNSVTTADKTYIFSLLTYAIYQLECMTD